jgi:hypothetical protein
LLATAHSPAPGLGLTVLPLLVTGLAAIAGLARRPGRRGRAGGTAQRRGRVARRSGPDQPGTDPPAGASTTSDESKS